MSNFSFSTGEAETESLREYYRKGAEKCAKQIEGYKRVLAGDTLTAKWRAKYERAIKSQEAQMEICLTNAKHL
jgi:hypothetical protein